MPPHRDNINLQYDRTIFTWLTGPSPNAPEFFIELTPGPDATPACGPYEPGEIVGEEVRAVDGVRPRGVASSFTLGADYITTTRNDQQPVSDKDRDSARKLVVAHTTKPAPPGASISPYADRLVWPENAPRTPGSRRATEANNALVLVNGKKVKKARAQKYPSGKQSKRNGNSRGPGGASDKEFDNTPYCRSIGHHRRGFKGAKSRLVKSEETSEFFE
ncbi:unnamed protein product [Ectocarpus sp. CCAP 1310/34]|nr:unnamed protein product [Ectocarpus sp. CCAP 1310/34]